MTADPWLPRIDLRPQRKPTCEKQSYDKRTAMTVLNRRTSGHQRKRPRHLRAYHCPACNSWHLTSRE